MARRRFALIGFVGLAGITLLPGCTDPDDDVVVAGRDHAGTVVAGAYSCDQGNEGPAPVLAVRVPHTAGPGIRSEDELIWRIRRSAGPTTDGDRPGELAPAPPPTPVPASLGPVVLTAVGDPDPPGAVVERALDDELPPQVVVEAFRDVTDEGEPFSVQARVAVDGQPDRWVVAVGQAPQESSSEMTYATAEKAIEDFCDHDDPIGRLLAGFVIGTGVALVGFAAVMVLAIRQLGRAAATADRRASGLPPDGP